MYAKLVIGATAIPSLLAIRDIGRLITSDNPSTSLLGAFSTSSSVIIDATPAGWTYVGSNNANDQPTIAGTGVTGYPALDVRSNLVFSAPCLEGSALKYAVLSHMWLAAMGTTNNYINLTCASGSTSLGVVTNEGPMWYVGSGAGTNTGAGNFALQTLANTTIHVIANPRHITLIQEGRGILGLWEMSMCDVNRFYGTAPVVQYTHGISSNFNNPLSNTSPTASGTSTRTGTCFVAVNAVTDVNTGTFYGNYEPTILGTINVGNLWQARNDMRLNSINAAGSPTYQVNPVFVQAGALGYPTQSVTGVVPIYWTKPSVGSTGDTIAINGDSYMWFNAGTGFGDRKSVV